MDDIYVSRRRLFGAISSVHEAKITELGTASVDTKAALSVGGSQPPTITDVRNKVAYITGGSSGIGLGIARALHEAGAKVVLGNLDERQFTEALKYFDVDDSRVFTVIHDVMDKDGWQRTADAIEAKFGEVDILVNNAGVGLQQAASVGTLNDWEWAMGVNFWGPVYGVHTFVPRMRAKNTGSHIVTTTSTSGILPSTKAGIYSVSKIAAVGLMETLRAELENSSIGTSALIPGSTITNIGQSEPYRPESLRNLDADPQREPAECARQSNITRSTPDTQRSPYWARPQDPMVVGRVVLDGIINNDLFIVLQPEWSFGFEARATALLESMVPMMPMPESMAGGSPDRYLRTPIYEQEIAHRRAMRDRHIREI
jgi:NAD(P)-dependent dehydrogenase (short-subunit alcohol dehydrogenase family)